MVKIIGNVKPEDDYTHPVGAASCAPNWLATPHTAASKSARRARKEVLTGSGSRRLQVLLSTQPVVRRVG